MQCCRLVLLLMGQCSLYVAVLYGYELVEEKKTWEEAREYCKAKHIDLATMQTFTDLEEVVDLVGDKGDTWIGLRRQTGSTKTWSWSSPKVKFIDSEAAWKTNEPNNAAGAEDCVAMLDNKWIDFRCGLKKRFLCYDERNLKKFHLHTEKKSWPEAWRYCRNHHTDLASGDAQLTGDAFQTEMSGSAGEKVWIGLYADTWAWSDGNYPSFWNPTLFKGEGQGAKLSDGSYPALWNPTLFEGKGACVALSEKKWKSEDCSHKNNFLCNTQETNPATKPVPKPVNDPAPKPVTKPATKPDKLVLINKSMTWERALSYCREKHNELVSATNPTEQTLVQNIAMGAKTTHVWMALRYSCTLDLWFWVDNKVVKYSNWGTSEEIVDTCDMSGAMEKGGKHQWFKKNANKKLNFICREY
ncbi:macrophage mannose receptor 1-like [Cyclopterus lumpus]|uniref:macrophage mannose receptor 1-like n=1 Tax=Cyclopterus lumpus TaxID=8103 RepID=UPI0014871C7E|nr:macrophage mannose receptor 1-like [Cyclopterus lumpus]